MSTRLWQMDYSDDSKRRVHPTLAKILNYDAKITKVFLKYTANITFFRSLRIHSKALEISCHGIVWLCVWMLFIFSVNKPSYHEMQVNMLIGLLMDIIVVCVIKAGARRRRPSPNTDMFSLGPDKFSFPSGHASRAAMIAYFFINLYPVGFILYPPIIAWAVTICLSRVVSRRHYLLDVAAGVLCGLCEGIILSIIWFNETFSTGLLSLFSEPSIED